MKIALIGSAPSSIRLAPYADPTWQIWGCSPGVYSVAGRTDEWFELHRWEPGVIGRPDTQKPWFSPEYVAWMAKKPIVWMNQPVPEIPGSRALPVDDLIDRYGSYFFTSSIAWMFALALERIRAEWAQADAAGQPRPEAAIGLFGIDMAATEEYGDQRTGCQFFATIAHALGILLVVPPESDLLLPKPLYGIGESTPMAIKLTERRRELTARIAQAEAMQQQARDQVMFLKGALDDLDYHWHTWLHEGVAKAPAYAEIFKPDTPRIPGAATPSQEAEPAKLGSTAGSQ